MANRFSIEGVFTALDAWSRPVAAMQSKLERFQKATSKFGDNLGKINAVNDKIFSGMKAIGTAAVVASAAGGAALYGFGKAGADFEEAIAAVGAVSLMTRDQIADLEAKAKELGRTTKFSATEVAKGMETMGRAGFTNAEVIAGIAPMLNAAAAEGAEFEPVAEVISSAIKGMGLAMTDTGRVADVLTLASARTKSSILSLGESIANTASTARQFNVPFEDLTAAVALLQDVGLDASVAGSAVNTMLTNLAKPSKETAAQMKALGISFQDAQGNMLPFRDVLAQFAKGAEKSKGNMAQVALFADLVGLRGQKAAGNLKDLFASGKFTELTEALKDAAGSAESMAKLRMQNLKGDLTLLQNAIDGVRVALFDTQAGPLRRVVQGVTEWVNANQELIRTRFAEFVEKAIPIIQTFAEGIASGARDVAAFASKFKGLLVPFGSFLDESAKGRKSVFDLGSGIVKVGAAFIAFAVVTKAASVMTALFEFVVTAAKGAAWAFEAGIKGARAAMVLYEISTKAGVGATAAMELASKKAQAELVLQKAAAFGAASGFGALALAGTVAALAIGAAASAYAVWSTRKEDAKRLGQPAANANLQNYGAAATLGPYGPAMPFAAPAPIKAPEKEAAPAESVASKAESKTDVAALTNLLQGQLGGLDGAMPKTTEELTKLSESLEKLNLKIAQEQEPGGAPAESSGGGAGSSTAKPQVVTPQDRVARQVQEVKTTTESEITLKVPEGVKAEVTKKPPEKSGTTIRIAPTGGL